ncbi:MAG: hypothetical protein L0Z50_13270 [Verrucomicrobiales bacterium]|nr:hypothetical protein [Verrucomicrobiales bacterium]
MPTRLRASTLYAGDRDVDFYDFFAFQRTSGKKAGETGFNSTLDFDGDGAITNTDLEAYRAHHLTALAPPLASSPGLVSTNDFAARVGVELNHENRAGVVNAAATPKRTP